MVELLAAIECSRDPLETRRRIEKLEEIVGKKADDVSFLLDSNVVDVLFHVPYDTAYDLEGKILDLEYVCGTDIGTMEGD